MTRRLRNRVHDHWANAAAIRVNKAFLREEEESVSNSSRSEKKSIEILKEKPLTLNEKLEKATYSKTEVLYCSTKKGLVSTKS
ncbi:UNVERIFIED_CONTAM: hypothetical protein NCL1_50109 [Trichonephila clavipes]